MMLDGLVRPPLVIAHRGVPGLRLEHSQASYELAIASGADFIEPDVVASSDGVLIVRHENEIGGTTNVAACPEFADRRTSKVVDGKSMDGWFTEDFTVAELKSLRLRERIPRIRPDNQAFDDIESILTFDEVLTIASEAEVGVYVETKHPSYFASVGISLNDLLVDALDRSGRLDDRERTVIQSFESANLRELRRRTGTFLVQLMSPSGQPADFSLAGDARRYVDLCTPTGLSFIAEYADAIGPHKSLVLGDNAEPSDDSGLVDHAHRAGLDVHIWTMRNENEFLPERLRVGQSELAHGDAVSEYVAYFEAGVDGVFSDFTATAVEARSLWWSRQ